MLEARQSMRFLYVFQFILIPGNINSSGQCFTSHFKYDDDYVLFSFAHQTDQILKILSSLVWKYKLIIQLFYSNYKCIDTQSKQIFFENYFIIYIRSIASMRQHFHLFPRAWRWTPIWIFKFTDCCIHYCLFDLVQY